MVLRRKIFVITAFLLILPVVLLAGVVLLVQSERGERWAEGRLSGMIHREVHLENIGIKLGWPPTLTLDKLRISNPSWATPRDLLEAEGVSFSVSIPPLFSRRIVLPLLQANVAKADLQQKGDQATWKFGPEERGPSRIDLERVLLGDGQITYRDEDAKTALDIRVKGSLGAQGTLALSAQGKFRGEPAKGTATIPDLDADKLTDPVRITANATLGRTQVSADGMFATDFTSYDMKLVLAGATLKDLHRVVGVVLPETPPYKLEGRFQHEGREWVFDHLSGKVGDTDLRGKVVYTKDGKRPHLRADLESSRLDFDDLAPLVGAPPKTGPGETASAEQEAKAAQLRVSSRVLPHKKFNTENWNEMDADVRLTAKRVMRAERLPIDSFNAHLVLKDGVMRLEPLNFGIAGGRVTSNLSIDSNAKPPAGKIKTDVQGVKLAQLFPTVKAMDEALGTIYGKAELQGRGASVGDLLGTSNGKIVLAANGGRVSDLLVQLLEIDVARAAMLLGSRKQQVDLRCAVGNINVKDGVASPESFVIDTTETLVTVEGTLDFSKERFDLITRGRGKAPSLLTLKSPIVLEGPLRKPSVHPQMGRIAAQVGAAAALGVVNPALAIIPFVAAGRAQDADCARLLAEAKSDGAVKKAR